MATPNSSSSAKSQASLSIPAQDEKTNGEIAPVNDSDTNKEDIKDTEHSSNSNQDNGGTEGRNLDDILDSAGQHVTQDMGFK
ncbi:hypothetical protein NW753_010613 [Fusarium oxysporum]|nr:hypothetical protein NW763_014649 [Fusarium oxysporum]KAJ4041205.1 hypothetical protein NW753_010613 [Fusarium oxysporum]